MEPMSYAGVIREVVRREPGTRDLGVDDARRLFGAMLDGGVPEFEVGALLVGLAIRGESPHEMLGFYHALCERLHRMTAPDGDVRPVVLPAYGGARNQPNLTPLIALLLQRVGVPVVMHGTLEGVGCVATAYVMRELGVLPSATLAQAQCALDRDKIAFVPTAVLAPGLSTLLSLRARLGTRTTPHIVAKLIDPFGGAGLRVVCSMHDDFLANLHQLLLATGERTLLMRGTEGEPFADPHKRPRIELFDDGRATVLFEQESASMDGLAGLRPPTDARGTAAYIRKMLDGHAPMPLPIINQLACCLYASGFTADFNQAKAIAAVQTHSLAAA
jgi:anthranilate phosphoribosyltransferase